MVLEHECDTSHVLFNSNEIGDASQCPECEQENDMQSYIEQLIKDGYIDENGCPLKCSCGSAEKDWEMVDKYGSEYGLEEYTLKCTKCEKKVGHWAYGHWSLS